MKKAMKIWLIIAAILSAVGLTVLALSLVGVGFDFEKIDTVDEVTGVYYPDGEFDTVVAELDTADIRFLSSEDGEVKVVCHEREDIRHSVLVQDGKLTIREVDNRSWFEVLTSFYFGREEITVYLPKDMVCGLNVETDTGDVTLDNVLTYDLVYIATDTGDILLKNSSLDTAYLATDTGDILMKNSSLRTTGLTTDTGEVVISSVEFSGALGISTDTGDIEMKNMTAFWDLMIETDTGDIEFERIDARNISIETNTGDVEGTLLSDKTFDVTTDTGRKKYPKETVGGLCKIRTDTGDIVIDIVK